MKRSKDQGEGCAILIVIVCFAIGIGELTSSAWGWLSAGAMMAALIVVAVST